MNITLWLFCIKYKNNYTVISMHRSHYNTLGVCGGGGGGEICIYCVGVFVFGCGWVWVCGCVLTN